MQKSKLDVSVRFKEQTRTVTVNEGATYDELVRGLMLNPEELLIFVGGVSVPSDERVKPEAVHIVKIVSGG